MANSTELRRKAEGLCIGCGKAPYGEKAYRCAACYQKKKEDNRRYYCKKRAKGLCSRCDRPSLPGRINCERCLGKTRAYGRKFAIGKYRRLRDTGTCVACGKAKPLTGSSKCRKCTMRGRRNALRYYHRTKVLVGKPTGKSMYSMPPDKEATRKAVGMIAPDMVDGVQVRKVSTFYSERKFSYKSDMETCRVEDTEFCDDTGIQHVTVNGKRVIALGGAVFPGTWRNVKVGTTGAHRALDFTEATPDER